MRSNPSQSLAAYRESVRHPTPRERAYTGSLAPALAAGSFTVELRAFMAGSSPEEIARGIRDLFTDEDQRKIIDLVRYGMPETDTPLHHLNGEPYEITDNQTGVQYS